MIDLHCHSHFSDGILSPQQLLEQAKLQGLRCMAITDHDTMAGYHSLEKDPAITVIPGIELSTVWKKHDVHILAYQIQATPAFEQLIEQQNSSRIERAKEIAACLDKIGIIDSYDKACKVAGHQRIGRPHFAKVLMNEGKAKDMQAAFKQYLGRGKSAFVPTPWVKVRNAVAAILEAGGQAVIAHPYKYGLTRSKLHELINEFKDAGGVGIEVVSGEMTVTQVNELAATCLRFNLLASSGSDYHGDAISRVRLGRQHQIPAFCTPIWQNWTI